MHHVVMGILKISPEVIGEIQGGRGQQVRGKEERDLIQGIATDQIMIEERRATVTAVRTVDQALEVGGAEEETGRVMAAMS